MMSFAQRVLSACALLLAVFATTGLASTIINEDEAEYVYKLYWDDLQPVENGTIGPGGTVTIRDATGIVELVGQYDNIYVKSGQILYIRNGILQSQ